MNMPGSHSTAINRFSLRDRRILYTGAAGGLGNGTTREMLLEGAHVVALDNNEKNIQSLEENCGSEFGGHLRIVRQDLADGSGLKKTLASLLDDGSFDIVINNAAIYPSKPFEDFSLEDNRAVQAVNVDAALICTKMTLPGMRTRNWGRIINISSITLYGGWENLSPYVQSKGALTGLTRAWAREFGKWGITVNAIAPGAFPTDAEKIHPNPEEYARFVLEHQAVKRRGIASDIASAIQFLASDEAGFITGQTINVDGGWVMK